MAETDHTHGLRPTLHTLGQGGVVLACGTTTVYCDPYLSDSVAERVDSALQRLIAPPMAAHEVTDADLVLVTHDHIDHCDPDTLPTLATASPQALFVAPAPARALLAQWGVPADRLLPATEQWSAPLSAESLEIRALPAAHPEVRRDADGHPDAVGYLLRHGEHVTWLAGDTSLTEEVRDVLHAAREEAGAIHTAAVPVNERNFFRDRAGILGNMSVREAFQLAMELEVDIVVPVHWDMFAVNATTPAELCLVHREMGCPFTLQLTIPGAGA